MTTGEVIALIKAFGGGGGSSGGGVLVVHGDENGVLDKTWKEISDAGFSVLLFIESSSTISYIYIGAYNDNGSYTVRFANPYIVSGSGTNKVEFELVEFATNSADGYPAYKE